MWLLSKVLQGSPRVLQNWALSASHCPQHCPPTQRAVFSFSNLQNHLYPRAFAHAPPSTWISSLCLAKFFSLFKCPCLTDLFSNKSLCFPSSLLTSIAFLFAYLFLFFPEQQNPAGWMGHMFNVALRPILTLPGCAVLFVELISREAPSQEDTIITLTLYMKRCRVWITSQKSYSWNGAMAVSVYELQLKPKNKMTNTVDHEELLRPNWIL